MDEAASKKIKMTGSILITGASSGIGRALAFEFSRRGYSLGLCARRLELLESLRDELAGENQVAISRLDVAELESVPEVLHKLTDELGGVKIVIANAGVGERSFPGEGTFHLDRKVIEINLLGAMATIDAGAEMLKNRVVVKLLEFHPLRVFADFPALRHILLQKRHSPLTWKESGIISNNIKSKSPSSILASLTLQLTLIAVPDLSLFPQKKVQG